MLRPIKPLSQRGHYPDFCVVVCNLSVDDFCCMTTNKCLWASTLRVFPDHMINAEAQPYTEYDSA